VCASGAWGDVVVADPAEKVLQSVLRKTSSDAVSKRRYQAVSSLSPARRAKAYPNERFRRNRIGIYYASENLT
jgi:hypothetical protein